MVAKKKVLITGAAGRIGTILWNDWEKNKCYELTLADRVGIEGSKSRVEVGDLRDSRFAKRICEKQDVVVSLAYLRPENVGEENGGMTDIGMQMQLFEAAHQADAGKIIFASSNHASGWNEMHDGPPLFSTVDQINPDSWYGAMKCMAEAAGKYLVNVCDRRFVGIRIGTVNGESKPKCIRHCSTLLAPVDAAQLFGLAVDYEGRKKFLLVYGASDNVHEERKGFLDLSIAKEVLGYKPKVNIMSFHDQCVE
ncbi:MAG: Uronate dehydrogenase [Candidatus Moanabacter tarae]|uniref:Uronate dehydrogenase n=1 Tax=Candidatus Moanibacter tarae TaxID=2200854 RepID=A0A2Z4AKR2_9BACT|nr:MAG: Uronate dehydrogenase [Candidatus Moanabacter tarae]|tara:strand:+ start:1299 stop:2054 length:756 start_codon:yes stop_codon:yes gene_type:complete